MMHLSALCPDVDLGTAAVILHGTIRCASPRTLRCSTW